jgi:hypothetical protein
MVLAELEADEAVECDTLQDPSLRPVLLVEKQAMPAQACGMGKDGLRRAAELAGNLAVAGAPDQSVEDRD